eukprot:TRINITY_DN3126_c0_g1_i1.p1 TRINITY_DN3126_c0_g1~~TRINITY_DN3126_c0_g1_i1.p1  ORF type:complete len:546 (-),score=140.50 TRINITY_DN3126_c0_g1_i1:171-1808(-)
MMATKLVALWLLSLGSSSAKFLAKQPRISAQSVNQTSIEQRFLEEVRGWVGKGPLDAELPAIKEALRPMWLALPKNEHGRLGNAQVRYALHRFFAQRHGWHIDGLDRTNGEASAAGVLRDRVPTFLMELFEEAFGKTGLMLHELAIFAGTLEHIIHDETTDRVEHVLQAMNLSEAEDSMDRGVANQVLQAFLTSLILGQEQLEQGVEQKIRFLQRVYPGWNDATTWLKGFLEANKGTFSRSDMKSASEQVSRHLGQFLDNDCGQMKSALLEADERSSGRISLTNFYKQGKEHGLHFVEKPEFLRNLGALDESRPGEAQVLVPNFLLAQSNCLVDTGFYSVCCINRCESVMAQLEGFIAAPDATPVEIVKAMADLEFESARPLTRKEVQRLEVAARRNGGQIALHGRIFAQWLHFVFPRDCPMPHAPGSAGPLSASEWMQVNEAKSAMSPWEVDEYLNNAQTVEVDPDEEEKSLWSDEEEILYLPSQGQARVSGISSDSGSSLLHVMGLTVVCSGLFVATTEVLKKTGTIGMLGIKLQLLEKPHSV